MHLRLAAFSAEIVIQFLSGQPNIQIHITQLNVFGLDAQAW